MARDKRARSSSDDELQDELSGEEPDNKKQRKPTRAELDQAVDFEQETQASASRSEKGVGAAAVVGVLKSITLKNFMCHAHFKTQYHPKMNFIHGNNGSGKSALLTGITVALGGRAAVTGRAGGLKDLIMSGKDAASVAVVLLNGGTDAFRPAEYGNEITIQRSFTRAAGGGGYKIFNAQGKLVSTKREDLNKILDHMNIQVDNPMNVLTQDNARSFIASTDEKVKYQWFLKGTQLDQLRDSYDETEVRLRLSEKKLAASKENLPDLERKVAKLQARVKRCTQAQDLQVDIDINEGKLLWAHVKEAEDNIAVAQSKLNQQNDKAAGHQAKADELTIEIEQLKEVIAHDDAEKSEFAASRAPLKAELKQAKRKRDELNRCLDDLQGALAECQLEISVHRKQSVEIQRAIDDQARLLSSDAVQERNTKQMRLQQLEAYLTRCQESIAPETVLLEATKARLRETEQKLENIRKDSSSIAGSIIQEADKIKRLQQQSSGNRLNAFGRGLQGLQAEIDRRSWHGPKPLGPLGLYINLSDMRYKSALLASLGSTMLQYAVQDPRDRNQLHGLISGMIKAGRVKFYASGSGDAFPGIVTHNGREFDWRRGDLSDKAPTVMGALTFTNEDVRRILITKIGIERTFIAPTRQDAKNLLDHVSGEGTAQYRVISMDNYTTSGRRGVYSANPGRDWTGGSFFTKDVAQEIQAAESNISALQEEQQKVQSALREADDERKHMIVEVDKRNTRIGRMGATVKDHEQRINTLKDELDAGISLETDSLHLQLSEHDKAVEHQQTQKTSLQQKIEEVEKSIEPVIEEIDTVNARLAAFEGELAAKVAKLVPNSDLLIKQNSALQHWTNSAKRHKEEALRREAELQGLRDDLQRRMVLAVASPRPEQALDKAALLLENTKLKKALVRANQDTGINLEEARAALKTAVDELTSKMDQNDLLESVLLTLRTGLQHRRVRWSEFRSVISMRARTSFISTLARRGHTGKLVIDHQLGILRILIMDDKQKKSTQSDEHGDMIEAGSGSQLYKGIKALSGGERSFATISLLLALWEAAECPIRCLDEFDVFMDSVNRDQTMKLLMETAKATDDRQFILITPQDIRLDSNADLKIIRVADPLRNQGVLEFGAV